MIENLDFDVIAGNRKLIPTFRFLFLCPFHRPSYCRVALCSNALGQAVPSSVWRVTPLSSTFESIILGKFNRNILRKKPWDPESPSSSCGSEPLDQSRWSSCLEKNKQCPCFHASSQAASTLIDLNGGGAEFVVVRGLSPKRTTRIWSNFPISSQFSGVELIPSGLANGNGLLCHSCSTFALFCCLACENKLKQILLSCKGRSKGIHFRFSFRRMFKKIFAQKTGRPEPREKFQF